MNDEEWRPIPDHAGYEASSLGRVKGRLGRVMSPSSNSNGYLMVRVSCCRKTISVHRLVAAAFLGVIPAGTEINHKDGVKTNNCPTNLEFCTRSANVTHAFRTGLRTPAYKGKRNPLVSGSRSGRAKLDESKVLAIRLALRDGVHPKTLAADYSISLPTIYSIAANRTWLDITLPR